MRRAPGFTLIEGLLGLALSLFVVTAGLTFSARAGKAFARLKDREEAGQAALAALDRMRIDLLHAGRGLAAETSLGLVVTVEVAGGELRTVLAERGLRLAAPAGAGETRLDLVSTAGLAAGRRVALRQGAAGEVRTITRVEAGSVVLDAPLGQSYAPGTAAVSLLETVTFALDAAAGILRRRVNAASAQPLLERAAAAAWSLDPNAAIVRVRVELDVEGAHPHETTVFLKNLALAGRSGT